MIYFVISNKYFFAITGSLFYKKNYASNIATVCVDSNFALGSQEYFDNNDNC